MPAVREETVFTVEKNVKKGELFTRMLSVIEAAGWEDISSLPSKDFYIMHSKGEDGKQDLYFQLHHTYSGYHIETTNYSMIQLKPLTKYEPGEIGVAGIQTPSTQSQVFASVCTYDRSPKHTFDMYYIANKDRLMFVIEDTYAKESNFFYIGKPNPTYNKAYKNQGLVFCMSNNRYLTSTFMMGEADSTNVTSHTINLVSRGMDSSFDAGGNLLLNELVFTSTGGGFIGYMDGVYHVHQDAQFMEKGRPGDIVILNYKKYRLFRMVYPVTGSSWISLYNTVRYMLIRID